jgi:haloacetate dehalogenase
MAAGQAVVMRALGSLRFAVVRPDRVGDVAHRTARDHPVAVERIAVLAMALPATLVACPDHEPD